MSPDTVGALLGAGSAVLAAAGGGVVSFRKKYGRWPMSPTLSSEELERTRSARDMDRLRELESACKHENRVPVENTPYTFLNDEGNLETKSDVVAQLCLDCDAQLEADYVPTRTEVRQKTRGGKVIASFENATVATPTPPPPGGFTNADDYQTWWNNGGTDWWKHEKDYDHKSKTCRCKECMPYDAERHAAYY